MAEPQTPQTLPNIAQYFTVKLEGPNYLNWSSRVLPVFRSFNYVGFVDGSSPAPNKTNADGSPNPAYVAWHQKDQHLLGCILLSVSEKVMSTLYGLNTSHQVWTSLFNRFSSQSRSRISHLKRQLQSISQGNTKCTEYLELAKNLADQLAASGKGVDDQDLISYIISGLNPIYNPFVTFYNFASREKDFPFDDFQAELLSYDSMLQNQHTVYPTPEPHFAMAAARGKFSVATRKSKPFSMLPKLSTGNNSGQARPQQSKSSAATGSKNPLSHIPALPKSDSSKEVCQICKKEFHQALDCFHRYDYAYQGRHPPTQLAAMVAERNANYENEIWFADSAANAHITSEAENLVHQQPYEGEEAVTVGNGSGEQNRQNPPPRNG